MANIGRRDTSFLVMLIGWDAIELKNFDLENGTTYAQLVGRFNAGLSALNGEFASDWMTGLYSLTDQLETEYRVGSSNGFELHTEYGLPDVQRADTGGHMLPLIAYDRMMGWTFDFLKRARTSQVEADFADAIKDARTRRRVSILSRLLKRTDDTTVASGLGATGISPGFATDEGTTGCDFVPPSNAGSVFDNTHEHYVGITGGVFTNAVFTDVYDELREHGHEPPFDFLCPTADKAEIEALSDFTPVGTALIRLGTTQDVALVGSEYFGVMGANIQLREVRGMPANYGFGYKSYGRLSSRNPLRIRVPKGKSAIQVVARTNPNQVSNSPLQNLMLELEFGVGVGDRTAGTPRYMTSDTWADGTAT